MNGKSVVAALLDRIRAETIPQPKNLENFLDGVDFTDAIMQQKVSILKMEE